MRALLLCSLLSISVALRLSAQQPTTTEVERIAQVVQTMHDMRATGTAVEAYQEGDFIQVPNVMGLTLPPCPPPPAMTPQLQRPPDAVRAGGEVRPPRVIRRVEPQLPKAARQARVRGDVILDVLIDRGGAVSHAVVIKPLPFGLSQAAIDAVRQWRFEPATRNGDRVPVVMEVTINFDAKTGKLE